MLAREDVLSRLVAVGAWNGCALLSSGHFDCWGAGGSGELGNGTFAEEAPVGELQGLTGAKAIAMDFDHTCAILSAGNVDCWGEGQAGTVATAAPTIVLCPFV